MEDSQICTLKLSFGQVPSVKKNKLRVQLETQLKKKKKTLERFISK